MLCPSCMLIVVWLNLLSSADPYCNNTCVTTQALQTLLMLCHTILSQSPDVRINYAT